MDNKSCVYKLKLKDNTIKVFNSQEELNTFIRDNKKSVVRTLLGKQTFFSQDNSTPAQTEALLKERNKGMHLRAEDHVYYKLKPDGSKVEGYTSTTQFISKEQDLGNPDKPKEFMVPEFRKDSYMNNLAAELDEAGFSADYIEKKLNELNKVWDLSSISGTSFHNIAENFVLKGYSDFEAIKKDYPDLTDEQAQAYFIGLSTLIQTIKSIHGDDAILLPEFIIVDEQKKLTGTIDLLVIDNKGVIHIYDYKTSFKNISEWKQVKKNAVDYQLTTYKQILRRQGFDVGKTKYIPVKINQYNQETNTVEDFQIEDMIDSTQSSRGDVAFKINLLLPFEFKPKTEFLKDNQPISDFLLKSFNAEVKNALVNKNTASNTAKQQLDYMLTSGEKKKDNKNREYINLPSIGGQRTGFKRIYTADPEEKNLQVINAYMTQLQAYNDGLPVKITDYVNSVKKAMASGKAIDNGVLWGNDDPITSDYINTLFGKYINSDEWKAFESDVMADLGIVAFENEATKEVDFISITGKTLRGSGSEPSLIKGKKLLGNVMPDRHSSDLGFYRDITNGDVELLKVFAFIQNNEATFKDKKIGQMAVVQLNSNQTVGSIAVQTLSTIQDQWNALVKHGDDFELKKKAWKVTERDNYESLIAFVKENFHEKGNKIVIKGNRETQVIENLKSLDKIVDKDHKIRILGDILVGLEKDVKNRNRLVAETAEKKELIFLVSNAIIQLQGINISVEDDVKMYNNVVGDNLMMSIPEHIRDTLVRHAVNTISVALRNATHKFNEDTQGLDDMHSDFYKGINATDFNVKVVGTNYGYFENLITKANGRFTWEFKATNDPSLGPAESEYIKKYLDKVNKIKRDKLVSLYGEGHSILVEFDENPPRDIPLMRATGFSALRNKGVKGYVKDYWSSLENETRTLETDKDYEEKINLQSKMFNQFDRFDTDAEARKLYLEDHPDSEIELDLENTLHGYIMANAKQVEFDKALPTLNSLKAIAMLSNNFYFRNLDNVEEYINMRIGSDLFGKKILAGENPALSKFSQTATALTSKLTLSLSVPTILNETFNNAFMSISKVFGASVGKQHFSKTSWLGAEALVWTDKMTKSQVNIGKMNFTRQLNSMFSIVESDIHQLQFLNQSTSTALGRNFQSNVMMKWNQIPNFAHRMSFFVAQMIEDGVIKQSAGGFTKDSAMKLSGEKLVYDARLDGRFKLYLDSKERAPVGKEDAWKESRARFLKLVENLNNEPNGINQTTGLPNRPYENKTRDALKSVADEIFGGYDPESKVMWANTAFGQLFNQFKNWMWAKKHRIWTETNVNGRQGKWVYDKEQEDLVWNSDIMEGLGNSLWFLFQEAKESRDFIGSWDKLSPERKERILWGLSDLVLYALLAGLAGYLLGVFSAEDDPIANTFAKSMRNATSDLAFWSAAGTIITPNNQIPMWGMINKTVQGTAGMLTGDTQATQQMMNSLGLYRTISPVVKTFQDDSE